MKVKVIEERSGLTEGKIYEVLRSWDAWESTFYDIIDDHGFKQGYSKWRFEVVEDGATQGVTLEQIQAEYNEAKKLIGKRIGYKGHGMAIPYFTVEEVQLTIKGQTLPCPSNFCKEALDEDGYVISLLRNSHSTGIPFKRFLEVIEDTASVKLNNQYTALVNQNGSVQVGCQKISRDKMQELIKVYQNFVK